MALRLLKIILLFLWAFFLFWLLTYGKSDLIRLLHPRLWWVLLIASIVLLLFLATLCRSQARMNNGKSLLLEVPGLLILLVPILYFTIAQDSRLDSTSLQKRIIRDENGAYLNNLPNFEAFGLPDSPNMVFSSIWEELTDFCT